MTAALAPSLRLSRLEVHGVRCIDGTFRFTGRDLVVGPNGSGKTTLLESVALLLFGYNPKLGKGSTNAMATHGGSSMTIEGEFVDSAGAKLTVRRRIDTSKSMPSTVELTVTPARGERSIADAEARIRADIGLLPGLVSIDEFLSLTPGKKAEFVSPLLAGAGESVDAEALLARLEKAEAALPEAVAKKVVGAWKPGNATQDNCAAAGKVIDEALSEAVGAERGSDAELGRLRTSRAEMDSTPGTAATLSAERDALRGELSAIEGEIRADVEVAARLRASDAAARQAAAALVEARKTFDAATAAHAEAAKGGPPEALEQEAKERGDEAELTVDPPLVPLPERQVLDVALFEPREAEAARLEAEAGAIIPPEPISTATEEAALRVAEEALERAEASPWREVDEVADRLIAWASATLPADLITAVAGSINALHRLASQHGGDASAAALAVTSAKETLALAEERQAARETERQAAVEDAAKLRASAVTVRAAIKRDRAAMQKAVDDANREAALRHTSAVNDRLQAVAVLTKRRTSLREDVKSFRETAANIVRLAAVRDGAEAALRIAEDADERARLALADAPGTIDHADAERRAASLRTATKGLDDRIAAKERARAIDARIIDAERAVEGGKTLAQSLRKAKAAIKGVVADLVRDSLAPLTETVADLLRRIDPVYGIEIRSEGGLEFFATVDDASSPVPFAGLSGGQRAIFGAALFIALLRLQAPKCRILPIEVAEVDERNLPLLLSAIDAMAPDFGSVMVATCHAPPQAPQGWTTLPMGCDAILAALESSAR